MFGASYERPSRFLKAALTHAAVVERAEIVERERREL
jgi:hypothetical protein